METAHLSGCHATNRADPLCTSGTVFNVGAKQICVPGWASAHRDVDYDIKRKVYTMYGITHRTRYGNPGSYEMDHLIPLELGGNNEISNLWPEKYPGYMAKDDVEDLLHRQVCNGETTLTKAQTLIRWLYLR